MKFFQILSPDTNFDFIGKFKFFLVFSVVSLIAVIAGMATKGLNYGIDFTGGTAIQVKFATPKPPDQVRQLAADAGEPDASVVAVGTEGTEFLITARTVKETTDQAPLDKRLVEKAGSANALTIQSADIVGPKVGADLKRAALASLFYSIILIALYIWLRFDIRFAPGATLAMVHDITMTTGFYLLTGTEFTITAVAALLTVAGWSVNDTIVVYDRIRDMLKKGGEGMPLPALVNKAVNITLSRTIITSLLTFLSILPVVLFCKGELKTFGIAMCFGIVVGTYSTVYIAAPLTIYVDKFLAKRENSAKTRTKPATA
jgi:preprotein translocase subunit SecF